MYVILKARDTIDGGYMYIIIKLKEIREQKNLSLGDLAKKTGISKSHLNFSRFFRRTNTFKGAA